MEPATIISSVMAVLLPFVKKGVAEFGRAAGQGACDKAQHLLDYVKSKLSNDPTASENLATFERKPEIYRPVIEDTLKERLATDTAFVAGLEKHLAQMGPELEVIQKIQFGKDVTGLQADAMTGGRARVTQEMDKGENVTGVKIGRIGGS